MAATKAFQSGLSISHVKETITETITETRFDKSGQPYDYKHTTTRTMHRTLPPDWRAGEAWLKRRDRENWSEKTTIEMDFAAELRAAGLNPAEVEDNLAAEFERLIRAGKAATDSVRPDESESAD